jgi:hypothetical protein
MARARRVSSVSVRSAVGKTCRRPALGVVNRSTLVTEGCDKDASCQSVLRQNWPSRCIFGDVTDWTKGKRKLKTEVTCFKCGVDHSLGLETCFAKAGTPLNKDGLKVLVGGPPCPPWSKLGKLKKRDDPRVATHEILSVYAISEGFDIIIYECVYDPDVVKLLAELFRTPKYLVPRQKNTWGATMGTATL